MADLAGEHGDLASGDGIHIAGRKLTKDQAGCLEDLPDSGSFGVISLYNAGTGLG
jgi:hypothetical protein